MPYSSNSDLPESVRSRYSDNCQSVFRHTWNSVYDKYQDEHRAFASATGQANKCQRSKAMTDIHTGSITPSMFKIFAPMLKASTGPDGKLRLHGIASSTVRDRHGDTMAPSALMDMEQSANQNLTIFLNHDYKVPEDVAGHVERAVIRAHPQDPDVHDLAMDIIINTKNERAVKAWEAIEGGTQLGLSIGAMIPTGGATRDRQTGTYQIDHVELLETSLVGVPANPRSWVEYAVKSLNATSETLDTSYGPVTIHGTAGEPEQRVEDVLAEVSSEEIEHTDDPPEDEESEDEKEEDEGAEIAEVLNAAGGNWVTNPDGSTTFTGRDYNTNPDVTDATVSITTPFADITVDTGRGGKAPAGEASQEAPVSAPETEDQDATKQETSPWAGILPVQSALDEMDVQTALEILEPSVVASLHNSTELLKAITRELIDTRAALEARNAEYEALEAMTKEVITNTGQILDKLSNTPAGRRAVVREVNDEFASLKSVYSEEFLDLLKRR